MSPLAAITPSQVLHLWHRQPKVNESSRLIAFSRDLARALQIGRVPEQARPPLSELDLPRLAYNALRRAGYSYIDEIEGLTTGELMLVNHVGSFSAKNIHDALARWRRGEHCTAPEPITFDPPSSLDPQEQVEGLIKAFYAWSSDRERMAALLLGAADLISADGQQQLRNLAMALVDSQDNAELAEVSA